MASLLRGFEALSNVLSGGCSQNAAVFDHHVKLPYISSFCWLQLAAEYGGCSQ